MSGAGRTGEPCGVVRGPAWMKSSLRECDEAAHLDQRYLKLPGEKLGLSQKAGR